MSLNVNLKFGSEDITSLDLTKKEVVLTTKDQFCAQDINVKLNVDVYDSEYITLSSIAVTTPPTKVDYEAGDTLNLTGMVITATYSDGSTRVLTSSDYTTSPANGSVLTLSTTTINIFYRNKTCTQDITVTTPPNYVCFTANTAGSTVKLNSGGWNNIQVSVDRKNWTQYSAGTVITLVNAGDKSYWRGTNNTINKDGDFQVGSLFVMTGSISASGNVNTLLSYTENITDLTGRKYCFYNLFSGCTSLTSSPVLPATTLADYCYFDMFCDCTSLATAPELPATTLFVSCYENMFRNCTSLATAPELPALVAADNCYAMMFLGCNSLTTAPYLPATTLAKMCYYGMFFNCSSLQVNDSLVSGTAEQAWRIPTSGTFTDTFSQSNMFSNCAGTRSSGTMPGEAGQSYTYYTQNTPV